MSSDNVKRFIIDGRFFEGIDETEVVEASAYDALLVEREQMKGELARLQSESDARAKIIEADAKEMERLHGLLEEYRLDISNTDRQLRDVANKLIAEKKETARLSAALAAVAQAVKDECKREVEWLEGYSKEETQAYYRAVQHVNSVDVQAVITRILAATTQGEEIPNDN